MPAAIALTPLGHAAVIVSRLKTQMATLGTTDHALIVHLLHDLMEPRAAMTCPVLADDEMPHSQQGSDDLCAELSATV